MRIDWRSALLALSALAGALAGCGGREQVQPALLYAVDVTNGAIGTYPVLAPPAGPLSGRVIGGVPAIGYSIAYDASTDRLLAVSAGKVVVYDGASKAEGGILPSRSIEPSTGTLGYPYALAYDKARDTAYLLGTTPSGGAVQAFRGAGTASGSQAPAFQIDVGRAQTMALDPGRSTLYLSSAGVVTALAFDPDTGAPGASRLMAATGSGVSVDPGRDRLYVADVSGGVTILDGASSGGGTPAAVVAVANAQFVTVDPRGDRLYLGASDKVYVLEGASALGTQAVSAARAARAPAGTSIAGFAFP